MLGLSKDMHSTIYPHFIHLLIVEDLRDRKTAMDYFNCKSVGLNLECPSSRAGGRKNRCDGEGAVAMGEGCGKSREDWWSEKAA